MGVTILQCIMPVMLLKKWKSVCLFGEFLSVVNVVALSEEKPQKP
jgi:hypothetical protein